MSPSREEEQEAARLARYGSYVLFGTAMVQLVGGLALLPYAREFVPNAGAVSILVLVVVVSGLFAGLGWFCRLCPLPAMFGGLMFCVFIGAGLLIVEGTTYFAILYAVSFYLLFQLVKEMLRA
jgi:hypothetical protein